MCSKKRKQEEPIPSIDYADFILRNIVSTKTDVHSILLTLILFTFSICEYFKMNSEVKEHLWQQACEGTNRGELEADVWRVIGTQLMMLNLAGKRK